MNWLRKVKWALPFIILTAFYPLFQIRACASESDTQKAVSKKTTDLRIQSLDDRVPSLNPLRPRTQEQDNEIQAIAWFCTAFLHQTRGENLAAFRAYQQVVHFDAGSTESYQALWRLALEMRRIDSAVRYLVSMLKLDPNGYQEVYQLAQMLTRSQDHSHAVQLLEQLSQSEPLQENRMAYLSVMNQLGQLYSKQERFSKAAKAYQQVRLAIDNPESQGLDESRLKRALGVPPLRAYFQIAQSYQKAGKHHDALTLFKHIGEQQENYPELNLEKADSYIATGEPQIAHDAITSYLEEQAGSSQRKAYQLLGLALDKLSRSSEFLPQLEEAAKNNSSLKYLLANRLLSEGEYERARLLYISLLAQTPQPEGFQKLTSLFHKTENPEQLFDHLGRTWRENNNRLDVVRRELRDVAKDDVFLKSLVSVAKKQLQKDDSEISTGSIYAVARITEIAELIDESIAFYRESLKRSSDPRWHFQLGLLLFRNNRYEEATVVFRNAINQNARTAVMFHVFLVRALTLDSKTDKALEAATEAREIFSSGRSPAYLRAAMEALQAWIYYYAREWDKAESAYQALIDSYWDEWTYGLAESQQMLPLNALREAHFMLSNIYVERGDHDRSEEMLLRILNDSPDDPHANNDLGYLWADQEKNLLQAEKMIRKAVDAEPQNTAYMDSLGWVLFKLNKAEEARDTLKQASQQPDGDDPVIWDHLGDVYFQLKQSDQAKSSWEKSMDLLKKAQEPDAEQIDQIRKKIDQIR